MGIFRFQRKPAVKSRKVRTAPLLPEPGLSGSARRVNGVVATFALFGAFGAVALAVALTPGAQQSASSAKASQPAMVTGEVETQAVSIEKVSVPAPIAAEKAEAEVAAKSDRLVPSFRAPARAEPPPETRMLREEVSEDEFAAVSQSPKARSSDAEPEPQADSELEPADPPVPGDPVGGAGAEAGNQAGEDAGDEVTQDAVDDVVEQMIEEVADEAPVETAPEEPAVATQSASVRTDVNMRAGPSNSAAVILVVPGSSDVEVIGCDYWCEVIYRGQRGWIYKGFVRRAES